LRRALTNLLQAMPGITAVEGIALSEIALPAIRQANYDVIVFGLHPSEAHSLDSLRALRTALPGAYLIASSFDSQDEGRDASLAAGANAYVAGFHLEAELVSRVLLHMRRHD
jgi:DNA-binding NarL/FixJ family response regulator